MEPGSADHHRRRRLSSPEPSASAFKFAKRGLRDYLGLFRGLDELLGVERLADEAADAAGVRFGELASSTLPLNMSTGIVPTPCSSWTRRHRPAASSRRGARGPAALLERAPAFFGVALPDDVPLELEVGPDVLAQPVVVVDDQGRRPGRLSRRRPECSRNMSRSRRRKRRCPPACRRQARDRDPTICEWCSGRRQGTSQLWESATRQARQLLVLVPDRPYSKAANPSLSLRAEPQTWDSGDR